MALIVVMNAPPLQDRGVQLWKCRGCGAVRGYAGEQDCHGCGLDRNGARVSYSARARQDISRFLSIGGQ